MCVMPPAQVQRPVRALLHLQQRHLQRVPGGGGNVFQPSRKTRGPAGVAQQARHRTRRQGGQPFIHGQGHLRARGRRRIEHDAQAGADDGVGQPARCHPLAGHARLQFGQAERPVRTQPVQPLREPGFERLLAPEPQRNGAGWQHDRRASQPSAGHEPNPANRAAGLRQRHRMPLAQPQCQCAHPHLARRRGEHFRKHEVVQRTHTVPLGVGLGQPVDATDPDSKRSHGLRHDLSQP